MQIARPTRGNQVMFPIFSHAAQFSPRVLATCARAINDPVINRDPLKRWRSREAFSDPHFDIKTRLHVSVRVPINFLLFLLVKLTVYFFENTRFVVQLAVQRRRVLPRRFLSLRLESPSRDLLWQFLQVVRVTAPSPPGARQIVSAAFSFQPKRSDENAAPYQRPSCIHTFLEVRLPASLNGQFRKCKCQRLKITKGLDIPI